MAELPQAADHTVARGRRAEAVALSHLERQGFVVRGSNVRLSQYEIDIVAQDGDMLVFVEVRARHDAEVALHSVDAKKRRHLYRAAERYLAQRCPQPWPRCRFDVVVVSESGVQHWRDAWRPEVKF